MRGTVVAVFSANPPALRELRRVNPTLDDLADMGDVFPGRERFATERIAAAITANVKRVADAFVDLHTGGDRFRQHPFVFYALTGGVTEARYDELARGFGIPTLWRDTVKVFPSDAVTAFPPPESRRFSSRSAAASRSKRGHSPAGGRRAELPAGGASASGRPDRFAALTVLTGYRS